MPSFSKILISLIKLCKQRSFPNSLRSIDLIKAAKKILLSFELFSANGKL